MKISTIQGSSQNPPSDDKKIIAVTLQCGNCKTIRTFTCKESFDMLSKRESEGFLIESSCEECGHIIGVAIAWIEEKPKYSYKVPKIGPGIKFLVKDPIGLKKPIN